jgi:TRAP-type transport system periplasmic protein
MKRKMTFVTCFLFVLVLVLAVNGTQVAAAEPVKAKIALFANAAHPTTMFALNWVKEMEKRTNGNFKGEVFLSEALGKVATYPELLENGGVDMARLIGMFTPNRFPMIDASNLPFQWASSQAAVKAFYELWPKGYFDKENANWKVVAIAMHSPYQILSYKPIKNVADIKGKRMRSGGGHWSPIISAWGAVPVQTTGPEVYTSLERGLLDGVVLGLASANAYKLQEIVKYVTLINMGTASSQLAMNMKFYNKLPKDIQKVINDLFDEQSKQGLSGKYFDDVEKIAMQDWKQKGVQFYTPTEAEKSMWFQLAGSTIDEWVKRTEKQGLPGKKLVAELDALSKSIK